MSDEPSESQAGDPGSPGAPGFFQNFQHTPIGARVPEKIGRGVFATAMMVLQTNDLFVVDFLSMGAQPQQVVSRIVMTATTFSQFLGALRHNVNHYEGELGPLKPRYTPPNSLGQSGPARSAPAQSAPNAEGVGAIAPGASGAASEAGGSSSMPAHPAFNTVHDTLHHNPPATPPPAPITELYEQLKFPEELMSGAFSNAVMIRHTPEEFCFDFISNLYPRPIVVSRVYASAGRVPSFVDAMSGSLGRYERGAQ